MDCNLHTYLKKTTLYSTLISALNNDLVRGEFEGKQALIIERFLNILEDHINASTNTLSVHFKHIDSSEKFYAYYILGILRFHAENALVNKAYVGPLDLIATEPGGVIPEENEESETISSETL